MEVTILPNDLPIDSSDSIQVYDYKTPQDIQKIKIQLSKNTISFLKTGNKEVIGEGKRVKIDHQHFLLMDSGNCLMTEKVSQANNVYQSVLLFFSDETAIDFLEKHQLYDAVSDREKKSFYTFSYDSFILQFVKSLESIVLLPRAARQPLLKTKFEEIMLYLTYQNGASFLNAIVRNKDDKASRLMTIVDNNKLNRLSLEELAFLCSMSISTFKREFFKQYQTTPMKWFNEQRLNHIALLLKTRHKRPIDLYEEAGYENFSNFVQAFKKQFGLTPKQYQRQI